MAKEIENYNLTEAVNQFRMVAGPDEFYDILSTMKPGQFMTFGYVTAAKLDYPKKKILNPATKRMNTVDDMETFSKKMGATDMVEGVIKLKIYNMQWQDINKFRQRYREYKNTRDALNDKYGFGRNTVRNQTQLNKFGSGVKQYAGNNADLSLHTYTDVNMFNVRPISTNYYMVYSNGKLQPVDKSQLPIPAKKEVLTLIQKLKSAGATDDEIAPLQNFDYRRFEHSQMLFISATANGIPTLFVNTHLSDKINGIVNVQPQTLIDIVKDRYSKVMTVKENANLIDVSESDIKNMVMECVCRIISEEPKCDYKIGKYEVVKWLG